MQSLNLLEIFHDFFHVLMTILTLSEAWLGLREAMTEEFWSCWPEVLNLDPNDGGPSEIFQILCAVCDS